MTDDDLSFILNLKVNDKAVESSLNEIEKRIEAISTREIVLTRMGMLGQRTDPWEGRKHPDEKRDKAEYERRAKEAAERPTIGRPPDQLGLSVPLADVQPPKKPTPPVDSKTFGVVKEIFDVIKETYNVQQQTTDEVVKGGKEYHGWVNSLRDIKEASKETYDVQGATFALMKSDLEVARELAALKITEDAEAIKARVAAEKEITRQRHEQLLINLKAGLDPENIKERVRREREISELRKTKEKALDKERSEQARPGFAQQAFQDPGKAMGSLMSGLGEIFKEMKEEFGKGGIGGIIDNLLGRGGGGKGGGEKSGLLANILGGIGGGGSLGRIGAMAGERAGGDKGAEAGRELALMVPKVIGAPAKLVEGSLRDLGGALNSLGGTLGPIGAGFDLVGNVLGKVGSAVKMIPVVGEVLGPFVDALTAIPSILKGITETLVSFAAKASPSQFRMFEIAVEDVQATIGLAFLPVLNMMTEGVRLVGSVIATMLPNMEEMDGALYYVKQAFSEVGDMIREVMETVGPIIRELFIGHIELLGLVLSAVVALIKPLVQALNWLLTPIKALLGLLGVDTKMRSSEGAAARPTEFVGLDEYQKKLQLEAYKQPGTVKPEDRTPNLLQEILDWLADNVNIEAAVEALGEYISKRAERPVNDFKEGVFHPVDTARKLFGI